MEEILLDKAAENSEKRKAFIEEAVDNFHKELEIDFGLEPQWNFMTAMYFAGTLFTTIGELFQMFVFYCQQRQMI